MAFYSARNTKITINGLGILVSDASLSSSSSIVTQYDVSSAVSQNYAPEGAQKNSAYNKHDHKANHNPKL